MAILLFFVCKECKEIEKYLSDGSDFTTVVLNFAMKFKLFVPFCHTFDTLDLIRGVVYPPPPQRVGSARSQHSLQCELEACHKMATGEPTYGKPVDHRQWLSFRCSRLAQARSTTEILQIGVEGTSFVLIRRNEWVQLSKGWKFLVGPWLNFTVLQSGHQSPSVSLYTRRLDVNVAFFLFTEGSGQLRVGHVSNSGGSTG